MNYFSSPTQSAQLGRSWNTTTFRLLSVYAVIFSVSVMLLIGFIRYAVTGQMERSADVVIQWQLVYFSAHASICRRSRPGGAFSKLDVR